jgi:predicted Zn finger-like uncharacterized protein
MAAENEIHLTCQKCSTVYRLDPVKLDRGRMVRCSACRAEWYQQPPVNGIVPVALDAPPPPPTAAPEQPQPPGEQPEWMRDEPVDDLTFKPTNKGEYFLEDDMRVTPDMVMPETPFPKTPGAELPGPVLTHQPMGMGAAAYGVFVFLLLFCLTAAPLMLFRQKVVSHYPPMLTLYSAAGIRVEAPGTGLSFASMSAEHRIDKDAHTLVIDVKLTNNSDAELPYPSLRLAVLNAGGKDIKDWDFTPDKKTLKAGETVPVALNFPNPPEEGRAALLTVTAD